MSGVASLVADGVLLGLLFATAALGLSLIMGIMGVVNVSHSAFIMLGSFFAFELVRRFGVDPVLSFFIALPVFFLIGAALYWLLITRVQRSQPTQGLIVMFGLMVLIENLGIIAWTTDTRVMTVSYTNASVAIGPIVLAQVKLIAATLALVIITAVWGFLKFSLVGRAIRAVGQNREAAISLGMNVNRLSMIIFGLGIGCAGAAGVALAMVFPFSPNTQVQWLTWAFLVVVMGGLGNVGATVGAGIVVGLIQSLCAAFLPFDYVYLLLYVSLAVILIARREGLSGAVRRTV